MTHLLNFVTFQVWFVCMMGSVIVGMITGQWLVLHIGAWGGVLLGLAANELMDGYTNEGIRVVGRD